VFQVHTPLILPEVHNETVTRLLNSGDGHHSGRSFPIDPATKEPITVQTQNDRHGQLLKNPPFSKRDKSVSGF